MKNYIICAAIYFNDGNKHPHQPKNIEEGFVLCGRRHNNCISNLTVFGKKMSDYKNKVQGFITSDDLFVDRKDAAQIAFNAGQTKELVKQLFSEDLY